MFTVDDNDLRVEIAKRLVGAEEVLARIESLLAHRAFDKNSVIYHKKSRVKTAQSIFDKIQDRRNGRPERGYGLGDVGDVVGFRLITLYDDSLFSLFQELMTVVEQGALIEKPVFRKVRRTDGTVWLPGTFNDCCVFAQHGGNNNPYVACHAEIKKAFGLTDDTLVRREIRENGYSSIHVQLDGLLYRENHTRSIPVEFQLRTALEDTWAEISHQLEYKKRYDRLADRDDWKTSIDIASKHLAGFKKTIDLATGQATTIRESYKEIDAAIAPMVRDREFIIERPVSLSLIEERCAVPFAAGIADAALDLHVQLNRLARWRQSIEKEGRPRQPSDATVLAPLKPKHTQDPRWRQAEEKINELHEYFNEAVDAKQKKTVKHLLELEKELFRIRILTCRIAQMRYEKSASQRIDDELGELKQRFEVIKEFAKNKDLTFQLIGAAAGTLAARYLENKSLQRENAARAFEIALMEGKRTNPAEIVKVAQTTLCLNALIHHLVLNSRDADSLRAAAIKSRGDDWFKFVELRSKNLSDAMSMLTKFYDPKISHRLYFDNIVSIGNNVLMFVVELHDAGVDEKDVAKMISSQQISNITEMVTKYDIEPEFRGHRLHTLCGVYRVLKRPEQRKRAARELREHMNEAVKDDSPSADTIAAAFEEELART